MNILHVSCSSRGQVSESTRLASCIIERLLEDQPTGRVVTRAIGGASLPHVDGNYATSQQSTADVSGSGSAAPSEELIGELERADVLVIGTPMHNFSLPSVLKAWIDHVARVRRTFNIAAQGKSALLADRPVFIAISSGGRFSGERARQPDFLTPYLTAVLNMIGLRDLTFFTVEGTAMGPDTLAQARTLATEALTRHFASWRLA